jgi:hypothetical protein
MTLDKKGFCDSQLLHLIDFARVHIYLKTMNILLNSTYNIDELDQRWLFLLNVQLEAMTTQVGLNPNPNCWQSRRVAGE